MALRLWLCGCLLAAGTLRAQTLIMHGQITDAQIMHAQIMNAPLPPMQALVTRAIARQAKAEALRDAYTYKETVVADEFDSHGSNKGRHTDVYQVWWIKGAELSQHLSRDGQALSAGDQAREQERIDKQEAAIRDGSYKGNKGLKISLSELLGVVDFSGESRLEINGRPTIHFNFIGDPKAKAGDTSQDIMKRLHGEIWIDEQDAAVEQMSGALEQPFRVAGGLLVNIKAGSWFDLKTARVNDEIWFLQSLRGHVEGHILLFKGFSGEAQMTFSDYRRTKTSVTMLPGQQEVDENGNAVGTPAVPAAGKAVEPAASPR
jgi:hypothetical protein